MMTRASTITAICIGLFWIIVTPLAFATLYSVIELQAAARAAIAAGPVKGDPRLATLQTIALAHELSLNEDRQKQLDAKPQPNSVSLVDVFLARGQLRSAAIEILDANSVSAARASCTASPDILNQCQIDRNTKACTQDYLIVQNCEDRALVYIAGNKSPPPLTIALHKAIDTERNTSAIYAREAQKRIDLQTTRSAILADRKALQQDPTYPIAATYRALILPFFQDIFSLPQGVVVACFTALMAGLGSGVSSLLGVMKAEGQDESPELLIRTFIAAPLLGALAGFMVYFVISAGAAFLVQGSLGGATEAVNNLSVPALASIGVFAGLAATTAIGWLEAKAASFFKA